MTKDTSNTCSKIYRLNDVMNITGLSRASIYLQMKDGRFPKQVKLSTRAVGWRETDLTEWMQSRKVA